MTPRSRLRQTHQRLIKIPKADFQQLQRVVLVMDTVAGPNELKVVPSLLYQFGNVLRRLAAGRLIRPNPGLDAYQGRFRLLHIAGDLVNPLFEERLVVVAMASDAGLFGRLDQRR